MWGIAEHGGILEGGVGSWQAEEFLDALAPGVAEQVQDGGLQCAERAVFSSMAAAWSAIQPRRLDTSITSPISALACGRMKRKPLATVSPLT